MESGLVLAGIVVTVIFLLLVLMVGLAILTSQAQGAEWQKNKLIGLVMVAFVATLLYFTTERWIGWFLGFIAVTAVKSLFILVIGSYWTGPVPRLLALELLSLCIVIVLLGYKFVESPPKTVLEKIMLVGTFISVPVTVLANSAIPLVFAACFLLAAHLCSRILEKHKKPRAAELLRESN